LPIPGTAVVQSHGAPPFVRIPRRSLARPWSVPRRLDLASLGGRLVIGKTRGLFTRAWKTDFRGYTVKARRAAEARSTPRKPRRWVPVVIWPVFPRGRWVPVVIWPVFPRGPLELPALGLLHKAKRWSIRTYRARLARRNKSQRPGQVA
jgi:hypothetical protein